MQPLALNHFGLVTCLGAGRRATLDALRCARSGLSLCHFDGAEIQTYAGQVDAVDNIRLTESLSGFDCRNNRLAKMALDQDGFREAVMRARDKYGASRVGLVLGTSTSGVHQTEIAYGNRDPATGALPPGYNFVGTHDTFSVARFAMRYLNISGPASVHSAACASTAKVFGSAARLIEAGLCDAAIVGGADSLCQMTLYGFRSLELLSEEPCRPFDVNRDGISIGEAAGFVLLEKEPEVHREEAIWFLGIGESADAYHMSAPHPEGVGARLAMERALASATLSPADIDYINLHGTATPAGDAAEDRAVIDLFGTNTPCSSTKSQTGHTLGASGIVEAIISALSLQSGFMPGSALTQTVDPALRCRYLTDGSESRLVRIMSNSFGFGGSNCSLILGHA